MTIEKILPKVHYNGDGHSTKFPTQFEFQRPEDLTVIHVSETAHAQWFLGSHYTVEDAGNIRGGCVIVKPEFAPAVNEVIWIFRRPVEVQSTSLPLGGDFSTTDVERMVDRLTMMVQSHSEMLRRCLKFADHSPQEDIVVPEPEDGKVLGWCDGELSNVR